MEKLSDVLCDEMFAVMAESKAGVRELIPAVNTLIEKDLMLKFLNTVQLKSQIPDVLKSVVDAYVETTLPIVNMCQVPGYFKTFIQNRKNDWKEIGTIVAQMERDIFVRYREEYQSAQMIILDIYIHNTLEQWNEAPEEFHRARLEEAAKYIDGMVLVQKKPLGLRPIYAKFYSALGGMYQELVS